MTTRKIAVSLPESTLAKARAAVKRGRAANVSQLVARAVEETVANESFEALIADMIRTTSASPSEIRKERARARADFDRWDRERRGAKKVG